MSILTNQNNRYRQLVNPLQSSAMLILAFCFSAVITATSMEVSTVSTEVQNLPPTLAKTQITDQVSTSQSVEVLASVTEKVLPKRSLENFVGDGAWAGGFGGVSWTPSTVKISSLPSSWNSWNSAAHRLISGPSPTEVANAIAAAKQASANVLIAQQQMQAAKENVLQQQRIAMEKEAAAAILTQKSEAAAAIQRSEAAAAAQAVVLAQQRLAAAKATVSQQQRIAAAKEAEAAAALHRSAHAAAAEIHKTEMEASKLGQYSRNNQAGAAHHLTLAKDSAVSSITSGTNHVPLESIGAWLHSNGVHSKSSAGWL